MYWNESKETMSRDELSHLQLVRLKKTVERAYHNVEPYRKQMQEKGLMPSDIQTLDDLKLLPFMTKNDLRDSYPYGRFGVPMSEIVRIHASSGTTGKQTVVGYTRNDLQVWAELVARCMVACGLTKNDVVQVS